ncbi:MAG: hypothetical protein QXO84_03750 [Candidatus Aenigmatarchaeota archaeon]
MCFILLLDKPAGITSREACEIVKKELNAKKVGHSGTLDVNATGLLILAVDEATKIMPLFERMDKTYEGVMHLHKDVERDLLEEAIKKFTGKIIQKPPVKSRVKRVERERFVYFFEINEIDGRDVKFLTKVEAGTYIRKLVDDIGKLVGGAHLKRLRRIGIGNFSINDAVKINEIDRKKLVRLEDAVSFCKKIFLKESFLPKVLNGCFIRRKWVEKVEGDVERNDKVAIFVNQKIIGIGVILDGKFFAKTDRLIFCNHH